MAKGDGPTTTTTSAATTAARYGTTGHAARLNERLAELAGARWRPFGDGSGLEAIDRRGKVRAVLIFEDGTEEAGR